MVHPWAARSAIDRKRNAPVDGQFNMTCIVMSNRLNPVMAYAALCEFAGGKSYKGGQAEAAEANAKWLRGAASVKYLHLASSKVSYHRDFRGQPRPLSMV